MLCDKLSPFNMANLLFVICLFRKGNKVYFHFYNHLFVFRFISTSYMTFQTYIGQYMYRHYDLYLII